LTASRPALGPTQPPIHWVPEVKWPGLEADHPICLHGMVLRSTGTTLPLPLVTIYFVLNITTLFGEVSGKSIIINFLSYIRKKFLKNYFI